MIWTIAAVIMVIGGVVFGLFCLIRWVLDGIYTKASEGVGTIFSGLPQKYLDVVLKLIACLFVVGAGAGVLHFLYKWEFLEKVLMICIIAVFFLIAISPIISIFYSGFKGVPMKLVCASVAIAIASQILLWLYKWKFLSDVFTGCIIAIVFFIVIHIIVKIFSSR